MFPSIRFEDSRPLASGILRHVAMMPIPVLAFCTTTVASVIVVIENFTQLLRWES